MFKYKNGISKKEKPTIVGLLNELSDDYADFYVTKNYQRIFLNENIDLLFRLLRTGEKIVYNEKGLLITTGFSDKSERKYVKILAENEQIADKLLKVLLWNVNTINLWIKVKANNPIINALINNGWRIFKYRGQEILYVRRPKPNGQNQIKNTKFD